MNNRHGLRRRLRGLVMVSAVMALGASGQAETYKLERGSDLQAIIDHAADGDTIRLGAKEFSASPKRFTDPLCGNCEDPVTDVAASYGFKIEGKGLVIVGAGRSKTRLVTNAGYGVFFDNADGSQLRDLTVTGGRRDDDGNATDAGIVVRRSQVTIEDVDVVNNDARAQDESVVVGIGGIIGREGAELMVRDCRITNNGWDGIALYRGASATVSDCIIKDGRGAGVGVTWDASCFVYRTEISGYWKGIGSFGTSSVIACNNLVHDNLGWGMIATGASLMEATNNVIHHNGNCGVAPWSSDCRGRFVNNIVSANGWRDQWVCPCVGIWNHGDWAKWVFRNNVVWDNLAGNYDGIWDQTGINGNLGVDPLFSDDGRFAPADTSQVWNAGDSLIFNLDGTRSHIGLYGGPHAWRR